MKIENFSVKHLCGNALKRKNFEEKIKKLELENFVERTPGPIL